MRQLLRKTLAASLFGFISLCFAFSQSTTSEVFSLQVYPSVLVAGDSVWVVLTYSSTDGCPDYNLVLKGQDSSAIYVVTKKIDNSNRACTTVMTKFTTRINLGPLAENMRIFVDGNLLYTFKPTCDLSKKGVVVEGFGACSGQLLINEYSPYATLLPLLYSIPGNFIRNADGTKYLSLRPGDQVRFSSRPIVRDSMVTPQCILMGEATCCEITYRKPDCWYDHKGIVMAGIDGCTGKWLVKDLSPVYSYPRYYLLDNIKGLATGTYVLFGATDYTKDSARSILCPIYGVVNCILASQPVQMDTLCGTAYTGDSTLKAGTAILFRKGYRKAMKACTLTNGQFEFLLADKADYTVYVVPDRSLKKDYLPTFYINKLAYANADYYTLLDGRNEIAVNMRKFERRTGTGKIHGNVYYETANLKDSILNYYGEKNYLYTTDNTCAINLPVILFNEAGIPVAWTMSDDQGNYEFENIALDSYTIVTETAEAQAETSVSLSATNSVVGADILMKAVNESDGLVTNQAGTTRFYPNPVKDMLTLRMAKQGTISIYNSLGQLMLSQTLRPGTKNLYVGQLKQGMYVLRIGTDTHKLLKE